MRGIEFLKLLYSLIYVFNEHVLWIVITILAAAGLLKIIIREIGGVLRTIIEVATEVLESFSEKFLPEIRKIKKILRDIRKI